jgi:hypothetical protein
MTIPPHPTDPHPDTIMLTSEQTAFSTTGIIQPLDDCDPKMSFDHANIYTKAKPKRITRHIVLPYQLSQSSKSYTLYERIA